MPLLLLRLLRVSFLLLLLFFTITSYAINHLSCGQLAAYPSLDPLLEAYALGRRNNWAAVKELNSSYYIGETLLFTIYTHYGNSI